MPQPIILSTWSFGRRANAAAWSALSAGGAAIDAVEQACICAEDDPAVDSVGRGGLPDAGGRVSLDGCIMLSPARCGSVCFIRRFNHPVSIARAVMEHTPHVMLAGEGAEAFAAARGFPPADLLTDEAKQKWEQMKAAAGGDPRLAQRITAPANREDESYEPSHDTIGVLALDKAGTLAGACSTSGLAMKLPGRVGDSPIIGHGLYVHPQHGAAVATGHGELVMGTCLSFLAVELLRRGATPDEALRQCMLRLKESYALQPHHQVGMIALTPRGQWAHASLRSGYRTAVRHKGCDDLVEAGSDR
jgi:L-asparaginase/N4-(beta-N-acetylglucosaminyl)-L-asparaginase